jgi:hypothetical protein
MSVPNVVLGDAQSPTPVNHTFTPIQDGPETKWVNQSSGTILAGQETLAVEIIRPKTDAAQATARVVIWDPVEGTVDGQTVALRGSAGSSSFKFPPGSTEQEKKDVVKMMANALINPDIVNAIVKATPFN